MCDVLQALKRQAESLVGCDDPYSQEAEGFRQVLGIELEKVSLLYVRHERKLCRFFCSLEAKTDLLTQRIEDHSYELCSDGSGSFEERWSRQAAKSAALVQEPANRQVFIALTAYLVHIDALRNFALLNTLALLKIANHHCGKTLRDDILGRLGEEPFFHCYRVTSLVDEIRRMHDILLRRCFGDALPMSPRASLHNLAAEANMQEDEQQSRVSPSSSESDVRRAAQTDAKDLAAYCTWVNQKEGSRLPAWVCQGCEDPSHLSGLKCDLRSVSVAPLVKGFAHKLTAALDYLDLAHLLPQLINSPQQHRQHHATVPQQMHLLQHKILAQPGRGDADMMGAHCTPEGPMAHRPDSPSTHPHTRNQWQQQGPLQQHLQQQQQQGPQHPGSPGRRRHSPGSPGDGTHKRRCQSQKQEQQPPQRMQCDERQPALRHHQTSDVLGRRQHSLDQLEPQKRHCHNQLYTLATGENQVLAPTPQHEHLAILAAQNNSPRMSARACHALTGGGHNPPPPGLRHSKHLTAESSGCLGGNLRPQRSCFDLRRLDLQHQDAERIRWSKHKSEYMCGVQQAALDLSYLSLAVGSRALNPRCACVNLRASVRVCACASGLIH